MAKPDDSDCTGRTGDFIQSDRTKLIKLIVKPSISYNDYVNAVIATIFSMLAFYFVFILAFFFCSRRNYVPRQMQYVSSNPGTPGTTCK